MILHSLKSHVFFPGTFKCWEWNYNLFLKQLFFKGKLINFCWKTCAANKISHKRRFFSEILNKKHKKDTYLHFGSFVFHKKFLHTSDEPWSFKLQWIVAIEYGFLTAICKHLTVSSQSSHTPQSLSRINAHFCRHGTVWKDHLTFPELLCRYCNQGIELSF